MNSKCAVVRNINILRSFLDSSQVSYLIFFVTNQCNFRCNFCFYLAELEKGKRPDELTLEEIKKISKFVGPLIQLSLTGGEPFLREDLEEITSLFIENTHVRYITIPTNASLTGEIVDYLNKVLPHYPHTYFRIAFSIDGIGEQHDMFRSHPGAYQKILESYAAISPLRKIYRNLIIDANATYTANTQDSILQTLQVLFRQFSFDNLSVTYMRDNLGEAASKRISFQKYLETNDYLHGIERTKEKRPFYYVWRGVRDLSREYLIRTVIRNEFVTHCVAGRKLLVISETGEVYPCEILNKSMGNLKDFDFDLKKVLAQKENKELLRWIRKSRCKCSFECAQAANVLWGTPAYFRLLKESIKNIGKDKRNYSIV